MKYIVIILFSTFFCNQLSAQTIDSLPKAVDPVNGIDVREPLPIPIKKIKKKIITDSALIKAVEVKNNTPVSTAKKSIDFYTYRQVLEQQPYYNFFEAGVLPAIQLKKLQGKEGLFYLIAGLLIFFGLVKTLFSRYMQNLYRVFFRASLKQKQLREQLIQTPLPSLLLNILFIISAGLYATLLLQYYSHAVSTDFWKILLYAAAAIALIYVLKYAAIKFTGWVFNMQEAADTYIFIVFLINKFLAIFLIPLIILMAFANPQTTAIWVTLSLILVSVSFAYRYISSYAPVRREIKVNKVHFFLYICAFEIAPLLLIYKVLMNFFEKTL